MHTPPVDEVSQNSPRWPRKTQEKQIKDQSASMMSIREISQFFFTSCKRCLFFQIPTEISKMLIQQAPQK
jgi:hypothetical protein